ncbi:metal-sensing transcriptional repressor [Clostridium cuniculi]|uniref:metal-sensing transcriptional repressor n=1 Tax=Clostridium cuniculi TaxID=2548455 RepID=UPI00105583F1|nr:metal-sensing transcriptional repressor [Clostridium cuniculi]
MLLLIQLVAVTSVLDNAGRLILKEHIENCIVVAVQLRDKRIIDILNKTIN